MISPTQSQDGATSIQTIEFAHPRQIWRIGLTRLIKGYLLAFLGSIIVVMVMASAFLAQVISPHDPIEMNLQSPLQQPNSEFLLGTDSFGRDMLSRIIYGSRITLLVGTISVTFALIAGLSVGVIAGYIGGPLDVILMRAMDAFLTFPPIILAIVLLSAFGPGTANAMLALGIVYTPQIARLTRSTTLSTKEEVYVLSAHMVGVSHQRIILRYILPNAIAPVIVQATAMFAYAIIAEATLSFLGLGTQPPTPSWGEMISSGRAYMQQAYWVVLDPALAIVLFVVAVNFLGDGFRDLLDPKYRRGIT
jgi:peptide/nickel transport system permease protein